MLVWNVSHVCDVMCVCVGLYVSAYAVSVSMYIYVVCVHLCMFVCGGACICSVSCVSVWHTCLFVHVWRDMSVV